MCRKGRVCLGKVKYVLERSGMFRNGQVCFGKVRYV